MRIGFQGRPVDLFLAVTYTLLTAAFILSSQQGGLLAILLLLFVPGYVVTAVLFPRDGEMEWVPRIALSMGLSLAIILFLALTLALTVGLRLTSVVVSLVLFTLLVGFAALARRLVLPSEARLSATLEIPTPAVGRGAPVDRALVASMAASILVAAGAAGYVFLAPVPGDAFTELYLLGSGGRAEGYPEELAVSEEGTVVIGVANHEFERVEYGLQVRLTPVEAVWNETLGRNEVVPVGSAQSLTWFNFTLEDGENWTQSYTFVLETPGHWRLEFLLFRDGDTSRPYSGVNLVVRVTA